MYIYNPLTYVYEIWHKYDVENEHEDNLYQLFYNPTTNKKMYLYEFIQLLYSRDNYQITFQCGSYYEESYSKEKICLIANSLNITIIKGNYIIWLKFENIPFSILEMSKLTQKLVCVWFLWNS